MNPRLLPSSLKILDLVRNTMFTGELPEGLKEVHVTEAVKNIKIPRGCKKIYKK